MDESPGHAPSIVTRRKFLVRSGYGALGCLLAIKIPSFLSRGVAKIVETPSQAIGIQKVRAGIDIGESAVRFVRGEDMPDGTIIVHSIETVPLKIGTETSAGVTERLKDHYTGFLSQLKSGAADLGGQIGISGVDCLSITTRLPTGHFTHSVNDRRSSLNLPKGYAIVHTYAKNIPFEMRGTLLRASAGKEIDARLVAAPIHRLRAKTHFLRGNDNAWIHNFWASPFGSAIAVLNSKQASDGVLLVEFRSSSVGYILFKDACVRDIGWLRIENSHTLSQSFTKIKDALVGTRQEFGELDAGIVLTGSVSSGAQEMAQAIFGIPASYGSLKGVSVPTIDRPHHEIASVVGLLKRERLHHHSEDEGTGG